MNKTILYLIGIIICTSCSEWTDPQPVGVTITTPWERDPQLWEDWNAMIQDYKARPHNLVYVRYDNAADNPTSEKNFMRSLPDSLDIVSLTNAENFSANDAEDMTWMKKRGTEVLYQLDFASKAAEIKDASALEAWIETSLHTVETNALDGWSFTCAPTLGNADLAAMNRTLAEKLIASKGADRLLVYEGTPRFLPAELLPSVDLFVLGTETVENSYDLRNTLEDAVDYGVPKEKTLLAASFDGEFYNSDNKEVPVLETVADYVISLGPLAGFAIYDIASDYYHYDGNWLTLRSIITRLNP